MTQTERRLALEALYQLSRISRKTKHHVPKKTKRKANAQGRKDDRSISGRGDTVTSTEHR